jgi:hypothetical protein
VDRRHGTIESPRATCTNGKSRGESETWRDLVMKTRTTLLHHLELEAAVHGFHP